MNPDRLTTEALGEDFEKLFERYYSHISKYFARRGFSVEESQDLAQKTFLKAYQGWDRHRGRQRADAGTHVGDPGQPDQLQQNEEISWIFTIARNTYLNEVRDSRAQKRDAVLRSLEQVTSEGWEPAVSGSDPERTLLHKQRMEILVHLLTELPPSMRRCFELRFVHNLKYREIASVLQVSIQSVRSQLHQARKRLEALVAEG